MAKHEGKNGDPRCINPERADKTKDWTFTTNIRSEIKKRNVFHMKIENKIRRFKGSLTGI